MNRVLRPRVLVTAAMAAALVTHLPAARADVPGDTTIAQDSTSSKPANTIQPPDAIYVWDQEWKEGLVSATTRGRATKAIYLEFQHGSGDQSYLIVTPETPVAVDAGVVRASDVKVGDDLFTDADTAQVTAVSIGVTQTIVYGFDLGQDRIDTDTSKAGHVFLANGIGLGDGVLQRAMDRRAQDPSSILATLPPEWAKDYENALSGAPRTRRAVQHPESVTRFDLTRDVSSVAASSHAPLTDHFACLMEHARAQEAAHPGGPWSGGSALEHCTRPDTIDIVDKASADAARRIHLTVKCPVHYRATSVNVTATGDAGTAVAKRASARTVYVGAHHAGAGSTLDATATCRRNS